MLAQRMSRSAATHRLARPGAAGHSQRAMTVSTSARHMVVTKASLTLRLPAAECPTPSSLLEWCGTMTLIRKVWPSSGNTLLYSEKAHSPSPPSFSKDGKAVVAGPPAEPFLKLDVFANFAQFVYDDSNPSNPIGPIPTVTQPIGGETQQMCRLPMHSCSAGR